MSEKHDRESIPDLRPSSTGLGRTNGTGSLDQQRKKQAARERLEEIQAIEDPIERIKKLAIFFRRGTGRKIMSDLDMRPFLEEAQGQAFQEIEAATEEADDPHAYLKGILRRTDPRLIDDYSWDGLFGIVEDVRRKVKGLMEYHSDTTVQSDSTEENPQPQANSNAELQRFEFKGSLAELRWLWHNIYDRWIDKGERMRPYRKEFFYALQRLFNKAGGLELTNDRIENLYSNHEPPGETAKEAIDSMLKEVRGRRFDDLT